MTIHGFLTSIEDFGVLYNMLDDYDEVVKCQIPGHGEKIDYKLFTIDATLFKVLDTFDELKSRHDQVDIVGFSMGGALASWLCTKRPVNKAVLIAPANKYLNFNSTFKMVKFYCETYADAYKETLGEKSQRLRKAFSALTPYTENNTLSFKLAVKRWLPNINISTYNTFKTLIKICNQALEGKGKMDTPTLIMWGELDELVPKASIKLVQKHFTNAQTLIYKDVGHAMLMTNRGPALSKDIVDFLNN